MTDVLTTILTAPAAIPAPATITPPFPKAMCKTAKPAPAVTDRNIIKSNPIPVTALWTAAPWAEKPGRRLAFQEQPRCMTTAKPARTWENTRPVRAARFASMRNVRGCGMPPAVPQIVVIIVTSAVGKGLLLIPSVLYSIPSLKT